MCSEAQKEGGLAEKKLMRLESTRTHDITDLQAQLESARTELREQLKLKDDKITSLVDELGNSQALLNEKAAELAAVSLREKLYPASTDCIAV